MPSDTQVIFSMVRVGKIHPLTNRCLRYFPGFLYGAENWRTGLEWLGQVDLTAHYGRK
jgi:hypothetical protein